MQIAILLSTYCGEFFLEDQLNSIITQTNKNWKLYARDDGSTDGTLAILKAYEKRFPEQIKVMADQEGNLKSAASFMKLLAEVKADYYMFCDQDDVWLPEKIDKTLKILQQLEGKENIKPSLAFTDLKVVDAKLNLINNSMWNYSNIDPENAKDFYRTACLSSVTGCTIMINEKLKEKVLPYPKTARMHDWWISLNAIKYGAVGYLDEATILYRQHDKNVLGAETVNDLYYIDKFISLKKTFANNISVLKMLNSLSFKVNYFKFAITKAKIILNK